MQADAQRIEVMKAQDPGNPWDASGVMVPSANRREIREVIATAQRLLAWDEMPFGEVRDFKATGEMLSTIAAMTKEALRGNPSAAEHLAASDDLVELLIKVKTAGDHLHEAQLAQHTAGFKVVRDALACLHGVNSVAELIEGTPAAVCLLGFDRAILSRVDESSWIPENFYFVGDPQWAAEVRVIGHENPLPLGPGLIESESARRKVPLIATNVLQSPHVHRQIADATLSRSYAVAPVMPEGRVAGFLHADCYFQRRNMEQFDLEMLSMFTEGFGYALQRASLLDRMAKLKSAVNSLANGISSVVEESSGFELGSSGFYRERPEITSGRIGDFPVGQAEGELPPTRREQEVLRLMAAGETNAGIASQLFISEGTVKSHVKQILRKLGAANRAQAVSRWSKIEQRERANG
ncbi:LuxR C-terminal-related transcriptional regulator [Rhodococcus aetherivorans]|uniref:GAF modulated transcriptional regulator n=1 Tax=Rhodococcus sp. R04 TaxID=374846 RepID=G3F9B2_9NOCA|nr:GAF modulated transcriptional regulator [Rhodococcus sp. R04]